LPESPRWLASKGLSERAEKAMVTIEQGVKRALGGAELPPATSTAALGTGGGHRTQFGELFKGIYLRRTIFIWVIWFALNLSNHGIGAWLPSLYRTIFKLPLEKSLQLSLLNYAAGLLGAIAVAMLIDKFGRRLWIATASIVGGLLFSVVWFTGASNLAILVTFATLAGFFFFSNSMALYLYTPELYPTRMRTLGIGMASAVMRVASMTAPTITGFVVSQGALSSAFLLYGGAAIFAGLIVAFFGIETKGKVLEEISP
jgi:MFS transporter, putative metabolite:H+ symporter